MLKVESYYVEISFVFSFSEAKHFAKIYLSWEEVEPASRRMKICFPE